MNEQIRTAVIGGGASGLTAAIFAAHSGAQVTLFEKQNRTGRKISASGNGRCNITNSDITPWKYHGKNPSFAEKVLSEFSPQDTSDFFSSIGIPFIEERGGRVFPMSLEASSVAYLLELEAVSNGVEIHLSRKIESLQKKENLFIVRTAGKESFTFDSVILSCGSIAFKTLGGTDSGYTLASRAGHTVIEPFPAILPVNIPLKSIHRLQGIKWNCGLKVKLGKKTVSSSSGEVLFTAYGLSGPASLDISRDVNLAVISRKKPLIELDFFPDTSYNELRTLISKLAFKDNRSIKTSLSGLIKNRIPEFAALRAGLNHNSPSMALTETDIDSLTFSFKNQVLEPGKPRPMSEAVVAAGGISSDEINPFTMESKILKGLYITGELIDIDGDSGGYNLQFAWSTGAIAGRSQKIKKGS